MKWWWIMAVLILPMRNWNFWLGNRRGLLLGFDLTYEELKRVSFRISCFPPLVLILPMRNWNRELKWLPYQLVVCFDLTYEELKLGRKESAGSAVSVLILPMRNWNKEGEGENEAPHSVLILPMRNWNAKIIANLVLSIFVLILPMRNWNSKSSRQNNCTFPFWSYLWGIETTTQCKTHVSFCVLILPMRNWNTVYTKTFNPAEMQFWSYLWGIETGLLRLEKLWKTRFDLTYEELKPTWNPSYSARWIVLILPMRNWNACGGWYPINVTSFWSYLWGIKTDTDW